MKIFFVGLLSVLMLMGCGKKTDSVKKDMPVYEGPNVELTMVDLYMSDSTITKVRLQAPKQLVFDTDDKDFPEGVHLHFFNPKGKVTSTLTANKGYFYGKEKYYEVTGNVIFTNTINGDELTTEKLDWYPKKEKIKSDNFVTIKTKDEVLTGTGLDANQDFEEYTIISPTGTMSLKGNKKDNTENPRFDDDLEFEEDTISEKNYKFDL